MGKRQKAILIIGGAFVLANLLVLRNGYGMGEYYFLLARPRYFAVGEYLLRLVLALGLVGSVGWQCWGSWQALRWAQRFALALGTLVWCGIGVLCPNQWAECSPLYSSQIDSFTDPTASLGLMALVAMLTVPITLLHRHTLRLEHHLGILLGLMGIGVAFIFTPIYEDAPIFNFGVLAPATVVVAVFYLNLLTRSGHN
jgi:hypothetical protein